MLARGFARFGWRRIANHGLHASVFRATIAQRHQSTSSNLNIDDIVGKLANEQFDGPKAEILNPVEQSELNKAIRTISELLKSVQTTKVPLNDATLKDVIAQVNDQMSSINNLEKLLLLLHALSAGPVMHREVFAPIAEKIRQSINLMDDNQIIKVFNVLRKLSWRDEDLLIQMAEHLIRQRKSLSPTKIEQLAVSMRDLTFTHPRLVKYLIGNFLKHVESSEDWRFVSTVTFGFGRLKINSPTFWLSVSNWVNKNMNDIAGNWPHLQQIVTSCAAVNVPGHLIKKPIDFVVNHLQRSPRVRASAGTYLQIAYALAIFKALPNYEANKILQPQFFRDIEDYFYRKYPMGDSSKIATMRSAIRILQIGSSCRYDLSLYPKLATNLLDFIKENNDLFERVRHGTRFTAVLDEFYQNLYMSAPLTSHAIAPHLHVPTGTFLDAVVWVSPERNAILPIKEAEKSPNAKQVGVIFASDNLLTAMDAGTEGDTKFPLIRPIGDLKMSMRHLQAADIRPVIIDYYSLASISENVKKIKYIKESILQPSANLNKDWH